MSSMKDLIQKSITQAHPHLTKEETKASSSGRKPWSEIVKEGQARNAPKVKEPQLTGVSILNEAGAKVVGIKKITSTRLRADAKKQKDPQVAKAMIGLADHAEKVSKKPVQKKDSNHDKKAQAGKAGKVQGKTPAQKPGKAPIAKGKNLAKTAKAVKAEPSNPVISKEVADKLKVKKDTSAPWDPVPVKKPLAANLAGKGLKKAEPKPAKATLKTNNSAISGVHGVSKPVVKAEPTKKVKAESSKSTLVSKLDKTLDKAKALAKAVGTPKKVEIKDAATPVKAAPKKDKKVSTPAKNVPNPTNKGKTSKDKKA